MKINDAIFGAILLLLGVVLLVHVQSFPKIPGQQYGPAIFPGLTAAGLAICGAMLVVSGLRERATVPWFQFADWLRSTQHLVAFAAIVGGCVAYILWADDLGFLLLSPVVLFVWLIVLRVRPVAAVVTAVLVALAIWYAFYKLLRVPLPWGILKPWAF
jgi:putative tricarboxylic transport membrane protein